MEMRKKYYEPISILQDAFLVEDGSETQIAPYDRQFASKTLGQRTMTIFAGPMMNFVLAFFIFIIVALLQGIPSNEPDAREIDMRMELQFQSGLKEGDIVQAIDNVEISNWSDVVEVIRKSPEKEITFSIERDGE